MFRKILVVAVLTILPSSAFAGGFHLATSLGVSKFFNDGPTAFGLDVYPGYNVVGGLIIEGHLGVHHGGQSVRGRSHFFGRPGFDPDRRYNRSTSLMPFQIGARYKFDIGQIRPFVAAHIGPARVAWSQGSWNGGDVRFGINAGGGAEYVINEMIGVGAVLTVHNVFASDTSLTMLSTGVIATFAF